MQSKWRGAVVKTKHINRLRGWKVVSEKKNMSIKSVCARSRSRVLWTRMKMKRMLSSMHDERRVRPVLSTRRARTLLDLPLPLPLPLASTH